MLNRLAWRLDPLNGTTGFTYDAKGNLLSVTDARSNATTYACVNMDRLATRVDLLTMSESYQYDLASIMTQLMDRKSKARDCTFESIQFGVRQPKKERQLGWISGFNRVSGCAIIARTTPPKAGFSFRCS